MSGRIQKLMVAVGKKGVGKTFETNRMIQEYVRGNPEKGVPGRRVLILDVNDEFENIRSMPLEYVRAFSAHPIIEARRIRPFKSTGIKMSTDEIVAALFDILQNYRNGMLLLEDTNRYISDNMPNDLVGAICTNRHSNLDVILHYQNMARIQTKVWQNLNVIRFHRQTVSVTDYASRFSDKLECFWIAELIVKRECDREDIPNAERYFLYIDIEEMKILGRITQKQRDAAINDYLYINHKKLIKPQINRMNPTNPKEKLTEEKVFSMERARIVKEYF